MPLLRLVVFPPRWMRLLALLAFTFVAANLFWHGAQPYAVGLVQPPWDKVAHFVLYGGFGGTAWVLFGGARPTADLLAPMLALAVGVADEFVQSLNPGRDVGLPDLAADLAGALFAVAVLVVVRERLRRRPALARA
jgi:VanZ family protein